MSTLKSINQDDLRNHNLSVVLDTILRSQEPMSRAELAKATGLTRATMSLLISMLLREKILYEGSPISAATYGRPSTPLMIAGGRICGIGLQINTDGYGYMILDLNGDVVSERWISASIGHVRAEDIFSELNRLVSEGEGLIRQRGYHVAGAGLALPGLVTDGFCLLTARNLGWEQLDLRQFDLVERLGARADNEANLAAIAQIPGYAVQRVDGGVVGPSDSFLYISTDIGIGGAVVHHGRVSSGDHGFAGELGHVSVQMNGPICACGRRGCVEAYAGRRALVESAGIATGEDAVRIEAIGEVLMRWNEGDPKAVKAVDTAVDALASVMASAINMVDVDTVVLGGLWERFGPALAQEIEDRLQPQLLGAPVVRGHVAMPYINDRPALQGAAELGLRRFLNDPLPLIDK
ncbi:ROK family protein [Coriobacterium glomerans PW2]|uniref:ROK family protein n=1 Tax=Coriobacterium glomerans (strain ATCC 49209 / DSM 20642 / JCM 10262 / PW2) TaxID=700015 RepID=F2NB68_CORGP|nr:ROK family transcriptional regulator [Coriobacterium glomerans]AEB07819.1 ROK family protein [Coriobacterium glomerans PW2]